MNDDDKPELPDGADTLVPLGPCEEGGFHVAAVKDGEIVAVNRGTFVKDGEPIHEGMDYYAVDSKNGKVVDSFRLDSGPARVATPKYRNGWDAVFGKKPESELN